MRPLLLALPILLASCTYLKEAIGLGPQRPKVRVTEVRVARATLSVVDIDVSLRVDNPNSFDLDVTKLRYKMVAGELEIARGVSDQKVTVKKEGRAAVTLPLTIDARNAMKLLNDLLSKNEEIEALITATAEFDTPLGGMEVDFEDRRKLRKLLGL